MLQGPLTPKPPGALAESPTLGLCLCISEDPARPLEGPRPGQGLPEGAGGMPGGLALM